MVWGRGVSRRTVLLTALGGGTVAAGIGVAALVASRPPPAPQTRWSAPFADAHESMGAWAADDTTLYACRDQDVVHALDGATGARLWTSEQFEFVGTLRVMTGAGAAYYCQDQQLVSRELRSGEVRWTAPVVGINAEVLGATEDVVVVRDSGLVVIDAATGRRCWEAGWQVSSVAFAGGLLVAQTIVDTSRARLSVVHGVDPASGTLVWTVPPSGEPASPAVSTDEYVYLPVRDGPTCAYATATGELLWTRNDGTPVAARGPDVYLLAGGELQALTGR